MTMIEVPAVKKTFLYKSYIEPKWDKNNPIAPFSKNEKLMLMDPRDEWHDMDAVRWMRVPNFKSKMQFRSEYGRFIFEDDRGWGFHIYPTEFTEAVLKLGMKPGGEIPEATWQVQKRSGKYTIRMAEE